MPLLSDQLERYNESLRKAKGLFNKEDNTQLPCEFKKFIEKLFLLTQAKKLRGGQRHCWDMKTSQPHTDNELSTALNPLITKEIKIHKVSFTYAKDRTWSWGRGCRQRSRQ